MKKYIIFYIIMFFVNTVNADELYISKDVTIIGKNLYKSQNNEYISTKNCNQISQNEDIILEYKDNGYINIVWSDNSKCEVEKIIWK